MFNLHRETMTVHRLFLRHLSVTWMVFGFCGVSTFSAPPILPLKSSLDKRQLKTFELENGLSVLLIRDREAKHSTAAVAVGVGAAEDPDNRLGTAHLLEHLLNYGCKDYPEEGAYKSYVEKNQGDTNASTSHFRSGYHFSVTHSALKGGLERLGCLLTSPLLKADLIAREVHAVDSEHRKNLALESALLLRMNWMMLEPTHRIARFRTGTVESLSGITRDELVRFWENQYSANRMKLVVITKEPLDVVSKWIKQSFSGVPNRNLAILKYSGGIIPKDLGKRWIQIKPISEERTLKLYFELPDVSGSWKTKSHLLLDGLISSSHPDGLSDRLRKEDLANSVRFSTDVYKGFTLGVVEFGLTSAGRKIPEKVIELFLDYVSLLKKEGLREYRFRESQRLASLWFQDWTPSSSVSEALGYVESMFD
ncbi:MAG: insulinase family protein, partial [Bdellovibrionales bacterium]|nr:insulinase family protein [Bdellovibrionales bacterium]